MSARWKQGSLAGEGEWPGWALQQARRAKGSAEGFMALRGTAYDLTLAIQEHSEGFDCSPPGVH